MAQLNVEGLPDDVTIVQGYFVWSGLDADGARCGGGVEYPFEEDGDSLDYDGLKTIGMLTTIREALIRSEIAPFFEGAD